MLFLSNFPCKTFQFIGKFVTERKPAKPHIAYVSLSKTIHDVKEKSYHDIKATLHVKT